MSDPIRIPEGAVIVPAEVLEDVRAVVDYNWASEFDDFHRAPQEGNSQEGHVFRNLDRLDEFLTKAGHP